ncbi:mannose-1-phosphate guanylyltransferase [Catenulispora sp. GAS73]|uniref:sugar phosphate nucleotidyltransferase n=1 Tax=Catenulispora sp. GAS73 TaxID=3156269 RepID=UPI003513F5F4
MKAVILAGGFGSRLKPLSTHLPKPMVPVLNYPVLRHVIVGLAKVGVRDIGVAAGSDAALLRSFPWQAETLGCRLHWLRDDRSAGTAGALTCNRDFFDGAPALVVPADKISAVDVVALMEHHHRYPAAVTLAVHSVDGATWSGDVVETDGPYASAYRYLPRHRPDGLCHGSTDVWVVDPVVLASPPKYPQDFPRDVLSKLADEPDTVGVFDAGHIPLRDFGVFSGLYKGNIEAAQGLLSLEFRGEQVQNGVYVEAGVRIAGQVHLEPPVHIGRDVSIAAGTRVMGPAVIGHEATIGRGAVVSGAVLLPGATVPPESVVAEGLVGGFARLASATLKHHPIGGPAERVAGSAKQLTDVNE